MESSKLIKKFGFKKYFQKLKPTNSKVGPNQVFRLWIPCP
jgi:hypothetical protein